MENIRNALGWDKSVYTGKAMAVELLKLGTAVGLGTLIGVGEMLRRAPEFAQKSCIEMMSDTCLFYNDSIRDDVVCKNPTAAQNLTGPVADSHGVGVSLSAISALVVSGIGIYHLAHWKWGATANEAEYLLKRRDNNDIHPDCGYEMV